MLIVIVETVKKHLGQGPWPCAPSVLIPFKILQHRRQAKNGRKLTAAQSCCHVLREASPPDGSFQLFAQLTEIKVTQCKTAKPNYRLA